MTRSNRWTDAERQQLAALIAEGKNARECAALLGRERKTVLKQAQKHSLGAWQSATGHKPLDRTVPADFADNWQTMSQIDLCAHYGRGSAVVSDWCKRLGLVRTQGTGRVKAQTPTDFAAFVKGKSRREIAGHYGISPETVRRMCAELGIRTEGVAFRQSGTSVSSKLQPYHKTAMAPQRDMTRAGMAADWLRRFGPVVRCNAAGAYDPRGDHWRRGSTVLTADEVIDRAERNGWAPDAWKALAA